MLTNYIKVAWRNLVKNKVYSGINILGLAAGLTIALLIGLWITDELSFDRNFANYNRIVRVLENSTHSGNTETFRSIPIPLGPELRTNMARISKGSPLPPGSNPISSPTATKRSAPTACSPNPTSPRYSP
jgi:putative ABC transport system permease protein